MKIAIDLGHGVGKDRGAEGIVTEESIINNVGALVIAKLRDIGHTVIEVRPTQVDSVSDSLIKRVDHANAKNVDIYVSIHANAGGGKGTEVYSYRGNEVEQARNVLNNITALGFINRGIKSSNLYVINHTRAKAILIEICFVDTKSDIDLYNCIGSDNVANAIVGGLVGQTVTIPVMQDVVQNTIVSNWVSNLQSECNNQGFSNQVVDGIIGVNTLNGCPLIKQGAKDNITVILQARLNDLGFNCGSVDGIFGGNTKAAVIAFQRQFGLVADGIVGQNTWRKLLGM